MDRVRRHWSSVISKDGQVAIIVTGWLTRAPVEIVSASIVLMSARLGNGCTSGHGICGMGRLSWRSVVATLVFMAAGIMSVTLFGLGA